MGARTASAHLPTRLSLLVRAHTLSEGDISVFEAMLTMPMVMPSIGCISDSLRRDVRFRVFICARGRG